MTNSVQVTTDIQTIEITNVNNVVEISSPGPKGADGTTPNLSTSSVLYASYTGQTNFNALTISGSSVATQAYVQANTPSIAASANYAFNSSSLAGQPGSYYYPASSISNASVAYATSAGNSSSTSQTSFPILTSGSVNITSTSSTTVPLTIIGASNQSANLQQWVNGSGSTYSYVDSSGIINTQTIITSSGASGISGYALNIKNGSQPSEYRTIEIVPASLATGQKIIGWTSGGTNALQFVSKWSGSGAENNKLILNIGNAGISLFTASVSSVTGIETFRFDGSANLNIKNSISSPSALSLSDGGILYISSGVLRYFTASTSTNAIQIDSPSSSSVPIVIKGVTSQSANLQEWKNSGGTTVAYTTNGGTGFFTQLLLPPASQISNNVDSGQGYLRFRTTGPIFTQSTTTNVGLVVQAASAQTANLQEWKNSSASVLASVNASGGANFAAASVGGQSLTPAQVSANLYLTYNFI